jgi:hypothetical protein
MAGMQYRQRSNLLRQSLKSWKSNRICLSNEFSRELEGYIVVRTE